LKYRTSNRYAHRSAYRSKIQDLYGRIENPYRKISGPYGCRRLKSGNGYRSLVRGPGGYRAPGHGRYQPSESEYKHKPQIRESSPARFVPWREPALYTPKRIAQRIDIEQMIKELEKRFDEKLLERVLERMAEEFEELEREVASKTESVENPEPVGREALETAPDLQKPNESGESHSESRTEDNSSEDSANSLWMSEEELEVIDRASKLSRKAEERISEEFLEWMEKSVDDEEKYVTERELSELETSLESQPLGAEPELDIPDPAEGSFDAEPTKLRCVEVAELDPMDDAEVLADIEDLLSDLEPEVELEEEATPSPEY